MIRMMLSVVLAITVVAGLSFALAPAFAHPNHWHNQRHCHPKMYTEVCHSHRHNHHGHHHDVP